tara:strand:- start:1095 stop:1562 length:468 start_codon:yes stop_codon:yes gene_type:complete
MLPAEEYYVYNSFVGGKNRKKTYTICRGCKQSQRNRKCNADPRQYINRAHQQLRSSRKYRDPHLDFEITSDDLYEKYVSQSALCALSGIPMENYRDGSGVKNPFNISIDRISNESGYHKENVQLVCQAINIMKGTQTDEQFIKLCAAVTLHSSNI